MTEDKVAVELAELRGTISQFMANWQIQDVRAAESRRDLHQKITGLQVTQAGIMRDLAEVVNDVAEMRPKVESMKIASVIAKIVWGAGIAIISGLATHFLSR